MRPARARTGGLVAWGQGTDCHTLTASNIQKQALEDCGDLGQRSNGWKSESLLWLLSGEETGALLIHAHEGIRVRNSPGFLASRRRKEGGGLC